MIERYTRRRVIEAGLGTASAVALAACGVVATPTPMSKEAPRPTEQPRPAEAPKPTEPAIKAPEILTPDQLFERHHRQTINGVELKNIPSLVLPFAEADLPKDSQGNPIYSLEEGFVYGDDEQDIHGDTYHYGADWGAPKGTKVRAMRRGFAMSSYQHVWNRYSAGPLKDQLRPYRNQPNGDLIGMGLGLFVMIYDPETDRFIFEAHLSECVLPFTEPLELSNGEYSPAGHNLNLEQRSGAALTKNRAYKWVEKGEVIGLVGTSGLMKGRHVEYDKNTKKIKEVPTWDGPHVHFEEFSRNTSGGKLLITTRDPYGLYTKSDTYPDPSKSGKQVREPILITGANGLPAYAPTA